MLPDWFQNFATAHVVLSIVAAMLVAADVVMRRPQPMGVMNLVWPLTMLYWGPLGLLFYAWFGRAAPRSPRHGGDHAGVHGHHGGGEKPFWQSVFTGATHCGAGCALGDFVGEWLAFALGWTLLGTAHGAGMLAGFVLAFLFGIGFQYFSVAPMQGLGLREGLLKAVKIDTLSILAYEVGMFAVMLWQHHAFPDLRPTNWSYWFGMQVAMVVGFFTTFPVNWWLIRRGAKESM